MSTQTPEAAKRLSTAIARAALVGVIVHKVQGDYFAPELFVASKWGLTKEFSDLDSLEAWLDRLTGRPS